jgi:hypothetical protein
MPRSYDCVRSSERADDAAPQKSRMSTPVVGALVTDTRCTNRAHRISVTRDRSYLLGLPTYKLARQRERSMCDLLFPTPPVNKTDKITQLRCL